MANEGRYLHKRFERFNGFIADSDRAVIDEDGITVIGGVKIGDGGTLVAKLVSASATVSLNVGSATGSLNYTRDTVVAGVEPSDIILANPIASTPLSLIWTALCYTAGVVQIRALHVGSFATGALAGTSWRIVALRF